MKTSVTFTKHKRTLRTLNDQSHNKHVMVHILSDDETPIYLTGKKDRLILDGHINQTSELKTTKIDSKYGHWVGVVKKDKTTPLFSLHKKNISDTMKKMTIKKAFELKSNRIMMIPTSYPTNKTPKVKVDWYVILPKKDAKSSDAKSKDSKTDPETSVDESVVSSIELDKDELFDVQLDSDDASSDKSES